MSKIKRISGTASLHIDDLPKHIVIEYKSGYSIEWAINHAFYRSKKHNKPFRVFTEKNGNITIKEASSDIPKRGDFYDVYKDGSIFGRE